MFFRLAVLPPPGEAILDEARRGNLNACEGYVSDYFNSAPLDELRRTLKQKKPPL